MPYIVGHGPEISPIMIVSDYPTIEELALGKALAGKSGLPVDRLLRAHGLNLNSCYKTSYIKCPMTGFGTTDKNKAKAILADALATEDWFKILAQEIEDIKPNVIISLGEIALNALTGEKSLYSFRGSILPIKQNLSPRNIRVIPTFHPRDLVKNQVMEIYSKLDVGKAARLKNLSTPYVHEGNIWICKTADALIEYWKRARDGKFLVFDIETDFNFITAIGFCVDGNEAVSIPMMDRSISNFEKLCLWNKVNDILRSKIPKVNQNIKYDWTVLQRFGFEVNNIIGDTMLMAHTLYPELKKDLGVLTSIYTDIPYYKDEGREFDAKTQDYSVMLMYNAKDALATWQVWDKQLADAEDLGVKKFYFDRVQPLFFHYKKLDSRGIRIDEEARQGLLEKYALIHYEHTTKLRLAYGKELNVNSTDQVAVFVYDFLGCPKHWRINDKGVQKPDTREEIIEEIYINEISDEGRKLYLKELLLLRKLDKIMQFLTTPYSHITGRMYTSSNPCGAKTGRTTMSAAIGWYYTIEKKKIVRGKPGTSFNTIPKHGFKFKETSDPKDEGIEYGKDIRKIFVPSEGKIFIDADGKNAEGHIVCVLAEDWGTLDYMKHSDLHLLTASWIYSWPKEKLDKRQRDVGKMARHAGNLGQGANGLSVKIHEPISFCQQVINKFHSMAPKVRGVFHWEIEKILRGKSESTPRVLINPFGRRRDCFGSMDNRSANATIREVLSFLPQSTSGDHYKFASLRIEERAPWAAQLFEAHDGLMWEIDKDQTEDMIKIIYEEMRQPINFADCTLSRDYNLIIPVEIGTSAEGGNWMEMEELDLKERGL